MWHAVVRTRAPAAIPRVMLRSSITVRIAPAFSSLLSSPPLCLCASHVRAFSAKSPRSRVELHPVQARRHKKAADAAVQQGATVEEAFVLAGDAADPALAASVEAAEAANAIDDSDILTVPSRLLSSEPAPSLRGPQAPTSIDSRGRASLRTKLHPDGAVVGRGRVVANFGTRMLLQELPWNEEAAETQARAEEEARLKEASSDAAAAAPAAVDPTEPTEGVRFIAVPRGKLGKIVCGDVVLWEWSSNHQDSSAFIVEVLPRATEFRRAEKQGRAYGREEVLLASNFHHMCIVCAAQPATNSTLLDRYLAAASRMGVTSSIIFNKQKIETLSIRLFSLQSIS